MGSQAKNENEDHGAEDAALRLGQIDAQTPSEVVGEAEPHMLPLTDAEKQQIEIIIDKKARRRFSLLELFLLTTVASLLLWLSRVTSLSTYTTFVGVAVVLLQVGVFNRVIPRKHRQALFLILLTTYLASAAWLIGHLAE